MLKAIKNYVVIKQDEVKEEDNLLINKIRSEVKPNTGVVIDIGQGMRDISGNLIPMEVKKDDRVIFYNHAGVEVSYNGELYLLMPESDIMCIIQE